MKNKRVLKTLFNIRALSLATYIGLRRLGHYTHIQNATIDQCYDPTTKVIFICMKPITDAFYGSSQLYVTYHVTLCQ